MMGFRREVIDKVIKEHRKALLNKRMNHIGVGIHEHPTQCFVVVIILANHVVREIQRGSYSQ
jgi:hypothetical protein